MAIKDTQTTEAPSDSDKHAGAVGLLASVNVLLLLQGLIAGTLQARALGPTERGRLAAVLAPLGFAVPLITVGAFFAATYLIGTRHRDPGVVVGSLLVFTLLIGVVTAASAPLVASWLLPTDPLARRLLMFSLLTVPLPACGQVLLGYLIAAGRWRLAAASKAAAPLLTIIGTLFLIFTGNGTIAWFVALSVAAMVIAQLILVFRGRPKDQLRFDRTLALQGVSFGSRLWLASLMGMTNVGIDQVVMAHLAIPRQLGLYAVAVSATAGMSPLASAVGTVAYQRAAHGAGLGQLARVCRVNIAATAIIGLALAIALPATIPLLFGSSFAGAVPMAMVLLVAAVPLSAQTVLSAAATRIGKPGLPILSEGLAMVVTVGGLAVVLGPFGGLGAAGVSLVAYWVSTICLATAISRTADVRMSTFLRPRVPDLLAVGQTAAVLLRKSTARFRAIVLQRGAHTL